MLTVTLTCELKLDVDGETTQRLIEDGTAKLNADDDVNCEPHVGMCNYEHKSPVCAAGDISEFANWYFQAFGFSEQWAPWAPVPRLRENVTCVDGAMGRVFIRELSHGLQVACSMKILKAFFAKCEGILPVNSRDNQ